LEISIISAEYSDSPTGPVVHLFGRDVQGVARRVDVTGFRPYFYAPIKEVVDVKHHQDIYPDIETEYLGIKGESLRKMYVDSPGKIWDLREKYTHHEADLYFPVRFMIDVGLTGGVSTPSLNTDWKNLKPVEVASQSRTCIVDIECYAEKGWPDAKQDPIICVTCYDSFEENYVTFLYLAPGTSGEEISQTEKRAVFCYNTEKTMLEALGEYIESRDPDILTGWNFTDFDLMYITGRINALGLDRNMLSRIAVINERNMVRGRVAFDLLEGYKKMHLTKEESYRLDAVAAKELGRQKVHYTGSIGDMWKNDPAQLVEYNRVDVELCVGIDQKNGIINFFQGISRYVGCPMDRSLNSSAVIDVYVLRTAHGKYVLPSKGPKVLGEDFEGALVFPPVMGLHDNVVVLDLKSLYPMIMITGNMSPETKDTNGDLVAPNGVRFNSKPDGLVKVIVSELLEKRDNLKAERNKHEYDSPDYKRLDMEQAVVKIIMNTYYGVSGSTTFRLRDREIAEAITSTGQAILAHNRKIVEGEGYMVVMGDTDACDVKLPSDWTMEQTIAEARRLEKLLNDSYPGFAKTVMNADVSYFSVKFEKLYQRFFSGGRKKRYAGLLVWKEGKVVHEIDVVGFEVRRSDSPAITKIAQKELIGMVLEGKPFAEVKAYLAGIIRNYRTGKYSLDEIGIPGGIGKCLDAYARPDAQIRGAIYANKYLGADFGHGSKPKRIYIKNVLGKYPRTDVICFEYGADVPKEFVVDCDVMMEKTLQKPLMRIMEALEWCWTDIDPSYTTWGDWGA